MTTVAAPRRLFRVVERSRAARAAERAAWLRLAAFVGLGGYAAAYWASFVADVPAGRVFWVLVISTALGAGLIGLGRVPLPRPAIHAAAALLTVVALGLALVAIGLPAHFLKPAYWDDFANLIDRGFAGLRTVTWPYAGGDEVTRLVILLAIPPVLIAAAALAFWPVRRQPGLDAVALVLLVALFGVAITDQSFGSPLGRGLLALILIAAWLWLPRLGPRTAVAGAAAVLAAGIAALPVAAVLDADRPWIDYYAWALGGKPSHAERFDWNHRYGPINWPRTGRTLLMVKSADPHYWKAETLDYFDGLRWSHTAAGDRSAITSELPQVINPNWTEKIQFSVRQLRSELVIGAGTIVDAPGVGGYAQSADGTVRIVGDPLVEGDSYSVEAYVPDPSAAQMKAAPDDWPETLRSYVTFSLPRAGENALRIPPRTDASRRPFFGDSQLQMPYRSEVTSAADRTAVREIKKSPYGAMYKRARRLARDAPTSYQVVDNIEKYLQRNMRYSERVPSHPYPLPAFLFEDKVGYCQQFSGAMALMLRMNGIPARVAGGFAPGIYEQSTKEYRVRDLDAHSWVEVYFAGIGWVPFDPTPTTSPAGSQSGADSSASAARGGKGDRIASLEGPRQNDPSAIAGPDSLGGGSSDTLSLWVLPLVLLIVALLGGAGLVVYSLLHERRHHRAEVIDAQLAELESALRRMGHSLPPRTTLTALELRLTRLVGPAAGRYARLLCERRYGPTGANGPGRAERAALRRELGKAGGRLGRIRALLALPPRRPVA